MYLLNVYMFKIVFKLVGDFYILGMLLFNNIVDVGCKLCKGLN